MHELTGKCADNKVYAQWRRLAVRCRALLAIGFESIVERDGALWSVPVETQSQKHLGWDTLQYKLWRVLEPELSVTFRMSYETTALSVHAPQS